MLVLHSLIAWPAAFRNRPPDIVERTFSPAALAVNTDSFSFALSCCLCYFQTVISSKTALAVEKFDLELVSANRIMSNFIFGREKSKCKQVNLFFVEVN